MIRSIDELTKALIRAGLARRSDLIGCSIDEVKTTERRFGVAFPRIYREFLLGLGRSAGALGDGEFSIEHVLESQFEAARRPRAEFTWRGSSPVYLESGHGIPDNAFVILPVDGLPYFFAIVCNDPVDSPVYYFDFETEPIELDCRYDSILDFLNALLEETAMR